MGRSHAATVAPGCMLLDKLDVVARGGQLGCFKLPQCKPALRLITGHMPMMGFEPRPTDRKVTFTFTSTTSNLMMETEAISVKD
jgi:hypothetical protein